MWSWARSSSWLGCLWGLNEIIAEKGSAQYPAQEKRQTTLITITFTNSLWDFRWASQLHCWFICCNLFLWADSAGLLRTNTVKFLAPWRAFHAWRTTWETLVSPRWSAHLLPRHWIPKLWLACSFCHEKWERQVHWLIQATLHRDLVQAASPQTQGLGLNSLKFSTNQNTDGIQRCSEH